MKATYQIEMVVVQFFILATVKFSNILSVATMEKWFKFKFCYLFHGNLFKNIASSQAVAKEKNQTSLDVRIDLRKRMPHLAIMGLQDLDFRKSDFGFQQLISYQ